MRVAKSARVVRRKELRQKRKQTKFLSQANRNKCVTRTQPGAQLRGQSLKAEPPLKAELQGQRRQRPAGEDEETPLRAIKKRRSATLSSSAATAADDADDDTASVVSSSAASSTVGSEASFDPADDTEIDSDAPSCRSAADTTSDSGNESDASVVSEALAKPSTKVSSKPSVYPEDLELKLLEKKLGIAKSGDSAAARERLRKELKGDGLLEEMDLVDAILEEC